MVVSKPLSPLGRRFGKKNSWILRNLATMLDSLVHVLAMFQGQTTDHS